MKIFKMGELRPASNNYGASGLALSYHMLGILPKTKIAGEELIDEGNDGGVWKTSPHPALCRIQHGPKEQPVA